MSNIVRLLRILIFIIIALFVLICVASVSSELTRVNIETKERLVISTHVPLSSDPIVTCNYSIGYKGEDFFLLALNKETSTTSCEPYKVVQEFPDTVSDTDVMGK